MQGQSSKSDSIISLLPTMESDLENHQNVLNGQLEDEQSQNKEFISRVEEIKPEVSARTRIWRVLKASEKNKSKCF